MSTEKSCTFEKLKQIVLDVQPPTFILPQKLRQILLSSETRILTQEDIQSFQSFTKNRKRQILADEVFPGIFVGDELDATDVDYLKKTGITHVLNVSQGSVPGQVNTTAQDYVGTDIKFKGLQIIDYTGTNLDEHLKEIIQFVDDAIDNEGKVLVHCQLGVSRSPSVVAAYLVACKGFSAEKAILTIRQMRDILPNNGFLHYLCSLEAKSCHEIMKN